jgi:hypothetical protein
MEREERKKLFYKKIDVDDKNHSLKRMKGL